MVSLLISYHCAAAKLSSVAERVRSAAMAISTIQTVQVSKTHTFKRDIPKHCQRHNGPEGWVLITSSNTNLDQISSSESRPSIIFKISTKHQPLHKTWASKSWPNLASESRPRFNLDSTFYKTSAEKNWPSSSFKSCLNFKFKILTKPCAQSLNKKSASS